MASLKELLRDVINTGPENVKKVLEVIENLPSDTTLQQLTTSLNTLIPYIPQLERVLGDGNIKNIERLVKKLPDSATLDRLSKALPMLEKMPDKATLNKLIEKAESLKDFLDEVEKGEK